ncbi:MAG: hypothetical protein GF421_02295 [Candidatus Aminicenantes bacterium]|nr:hypothetical protein [Candidatus Aminicenantes bacterium]
MKHTVIRRSRVFILLFGLFMGLNPLNAFARISGDKIHRDLALGYDFSQTLTVKYFFSKQFGLWGGVKVPLSRHEGNKKDFTQQYADEFMNNEFLGFSREYFYGLGGGVTLSLFRQLTVAYIGIGGIQSIKYRQYLIEYYRDHAFEWSQQYYIEDGKISEVSLDVMGGFYFRFQKILLGVGYSSGTSNWVLHAGASF